jgi:hypothetical protein
MAIYLDIATLLWHILQMAIKAIRKMETDMNKQNKAQKMDSFVLALVNGATA